MNLSMKWLSHYVDLQNITAETLAETLTNAGLEVETIDTLVKRTNLVIGQVLECVDHPDSDHLHVTKVDVGDEVLDIVCGAANVATNQKVIVAKEGAQIGDLVIKPVKLRGVPSNGMICSYQELGIQDKFILADQQSGIAVLADDAPVGGDVYTYMGWDDVILDVAQTPNRSDFMAMNAVAQEVGALLNTPVTLPSINPVQTKETTPLKLASTTKGCPQFVGRIIENIQVGPSPRWLKDILMSNNIKSVNNVVDISNLVMLETGQPCHFYDRDAIVDEITVIDQVSMNFEALDHETYAIEASDLLISSGEKVVGLAGIMGGESSMISESTTSIVLEMAQFDRVTVRQTSRRINLITDAATRFIKGIDPMGVWTAVDRATSLLVELANAQGIHPVVSIMDKPEQSDTIVSVNVAHVHSLLGIHLPVETIMDALKRLHFNPVLKENVITCSIPSYRQDIRIGADLIEEIIRMVGYDALPLSPLDLKETSGKLNPKQRLRRQLQQLALGFGLSEIITYTLINPKYEHGPLALDNPVSILSPLSEDRKMVRNHLFYSMLNVVGYNQSYKNKPNNYFELSEVYAKDTQQWRMGIVLSDDLIALDWKHQSIESNFYTLKGMITTIIEQVGLDAVKLKYTLMGETQQEMHPYQSAWIHYDEVILGYMGRVHPTLADDLDVKDTWILEVNADMLLTLEKKPVRYQTVHRFPKVEKDLAFVLDKEVSINKLETVIKEAGAPYIQDVKLFDVFESEKLGEDKHSLALNCQFVADHMYTEKEINEVITNIITQVSTTLGGVLR